jgi:hypothetical protein
LEPIFWSRRTATVVGTNYSADLISNRPQQCSIGETSGAGLFTNKSTESIEGLNKCVSKEERVH